MTSFNEARTYVNTEERYGDNVEVTINDYLWLNPTGIFEDDIDGIYELVDDEWVKIAEVA